MDQMTLKYDSDYLVNLPLACDPPIAISESYADLNILIINPQGLTQDEANIVGVQLRKLLVSPQ